MVRKDLPDVIYKTEKGKFDAIVEEIRKINKNGQPVLVGTIAIEKSEYLSSLLERHGVEHEVLNAKNHEKEAQIIAKAGQKGSVTIATNMAGRGTDIKLGEGVRNLGGLYIIGTERHEARRIDNQLRGRAGRQGDPGVSQFYVSLEDELMRRFGGDKLKNMMTKLGLPEDQPIQNSLISKTIENAQSKIEGFNFDIRKHVLEYDDVMNKQREVVYKKRREILEKSDIKEYFLESIKEEVESMAEFHLAGDRMDWDTEGLAKTAAGVFPISDQKEELLKIKEEGGEPEEKIKTIVENIYSLILEAYQKKEEELGNESMRLAEKAVALQTIDNLWMNHLDEIDYLREGIGLRGYGQRDPLIEYKREAFRMFSGLMNNIRSTIVNTIFRVSIVSPQQESQQRNLRFQGADENIDQFSGEAKSNGKQPEVSKPFVNQEKVGRNDPCPCGSGKKYKKCCGK
jgi:preprotein translocase subunit SecA